MLSLGGLTRHGFDLRWQGRAYAVVVGHHEACGAAEDDEFPAAVDPVEEADD